MPILVCDISIGKYRFNFVHQVTVESSWKNLTDTAVISLPATLRINKNDLKKAIPSGSKVIIRLGYRSQGVPSTVFVGYVSRVRNKVPVEIECEDEMWQLKHLQITENCKNEKLEKYLQRVLKLEVDCWDITVPSMVVNNITGAQLLDRIRQEFGFNSFFRNGKLIVGKPYEAQAQKHTIVIDNAYDCNVKSQDLEYMTKEDVKIKVTAISNMINGKKEQVTFGDMDGEERTLNFFNIPKAALKDIAEKEAQKLKYDGYRGDLTLFGEPIVFHGDILTFKNRHESDKTGDYYVDAVTYSFGVDGFQQKVDPGQKLTV